MTDDKAAQEAEPVDFVIGANAVDAHTEELVDDITAKHTNRRFVVGLVVAALMFVGLVVLRSNTSDRPTSASTNPAPSGNAPLLPRFSAAAPAVVKLSRNLCPLNRGCFNGPTPTTVTSKVQAAIAQTFGKVRQLHIRNAYIPLDDPPRRSLFARSITATTSRGTVDIVAAAVSPDSSLDVMVAEGASSSLGTHAVVNGYVINGSIEVVAHKNTQALSGTLHRLISDARIVAKV